jgi:hypothetical protein
VLERRKNKVVRPVARYFRRIGCRFETSEIDKNAKTVHATR